MKKQCHHCDTRLTIKEFKQNMCICLKLFCQEHHSILKHDCQMSRYLTRREKRILAIYPFIATDQRICQTHPQNIDLKEIYQRKQTPINEN